MDQTSIHLTPDDLCRMRLLRNNVIDLSTAIDDFDAEIVPRLTERRRLHALLREAEAELSTLLRRAV